MLESASLIAGDEKHAKILAEQYGRRGGRQVTPFEVLAAFPEPFLSPRGVGDTYSSPFSLSQP